MLSLTIAIKLFANSNPVQGSRLICLRTIFLLPLAHCLHFLEWVYFLLIAVWQIIALFVQRCPEKQALKLQKKIISTTTHSYSQNPIENMDFSVTDLSHFFLEPGWSSRNANYLASQLGQRHELQKIEIWITENKIVSRYMFI